MAPTQRVEEFLYRLDNCHENGGSVHEKSMTYERSLFSCYVMRRRPMTPVDEIERDLFTMTRFLGIEIRLAIAGTRLLKIKIKVRGGKMR